MASEHTAPSFHWDFNEESDIRIKSTNNTLHEDDSSMSSSAVGQRVLPAIGYMNNRWTLPDPEYFYCDDSAAFVMRFTVSDYISNGKKLIKVPKNYP